MGLPPGRGKFLVKLRQSLCSLRVMSADRNTLFEHLEALGIAQVTVEHAPMFTVEQSQELRGQLPGAHTKNLFLIDKNGRMVLVVAKEDTRVDLKALAGRLGHGRYSFAKNHLLEQVL
ncbi:MAG: YbaK/EbsC family protein, partial [Methyloceanibacter sp.]